MTTKNILHITYDMRIGGTEMVIKNIIDSSDKEQFTMSVLCIESPLGPFAEELQLRGIDFFEFNRQPGFDKKLIKNIRKKIKENNIDIIHCHQYTPWVYGVIAAAFTGTKVIFTEHGRFYPDSSTWKRKLINPILNLFTDHVTAISKATKKALVEFENIPEKVIDVIYNGIYPLKINESNVQTLRKNHNIPDENIVLGTVARFDPIKNHTLMLIAFAKVLIRYPNTTLIIVGDGEERSNIEKCIDELCIQPNVVLTGYESKPGHYIALMDVFLLSSLSEGTSMTLLEAMSIGKPCVVTDAGGNSEVIKHKKNGFVTANDDASAFSDAIVSLLKDKGKTDIFGLASKQLFSEKFSVYKMSSFYSTLYNEKT